MSNNYTLTGKMRGLATDEKFIKVGETANHMQFERVARKGSVVSIPKTDVESEFTQEQE